MAVSTIDPNGLNIGQYGNRNLIINGAMQVAQRGTSVSVGAGTYTLDRWSTDRDGRVTATVSQQSFTLGQTDVPGEPQNFLRFDVTAASGGSYLGLRHFIENVRTGAGQTVTLSFWAKADASRTLNLRYHQYCGSAGTSINPVSLTAKSLTTSWQKFTETFTLPSLSGKTVSGGNDSLRILFDLPVNTVMQLDITQVQLEVGDATPFEHRSFGQELALCQRYYRLIGTYGDPYATQGNYILNDVTYNNENRMIIPYLNPPMRTTPSVTHVNWSNGGTGALTEFSAGTIRSQTNISEVSPFGGGYAQFDGNFGNPARYVAVFDAEL